MENRRKLFVSLISEGLAVLIFVAAILFMSAGSIVYSEAWVFLIVFSASALFFGIWLYLSHPAQFMNRFRAERNHIIKRITNLLIVLSCVALIVAGLDKRFGWSYKTEIRYIFAILLLFFSMIVYRNVFIHNPFLSNTVEIHEGHEVVCAGMYGIVRHPMYLATICAYVAGLIILGSWYNLPILIAFVGLVLLRIRYEERQLREVLPEYAEYSSKVKHKLIPYLW